MCGVVLGEICVDRAGPGDYGARFDIEWRRSLSAIWNGIKILGCELLARNHILLHFPTTACVQMMTRLKYINRGAHKEIEATGCQASHHLSFGCTVKGRKITRWKRAFLSLFPFGSFVVFVVDDMARFLMHSLSWWMREIVWRERKAFAQLGVQKFERVTSVFSSRGDHYQR